MDKKEYMRQYQREWIARRRQAWIDEHGPCVDCGSWNNPEVDHVDPTKKVHNAGTLWSLALDNPKRIAELAKCVVRCHDCHMNKTIKELGNTRAEHGSTTMYGRGCRCDLCVQAKMLEWRVYYDQEDKRKAHLARKRARYAEGYGYYGT